MARLRIPLGPVPIQRILRAIREQYVLEWTGLHGVGHWARVLENGLRLAEATGADREVVTLFALFHDACRRNDSHDPGHGGRGGSLAASLEGTLFELGSHRLDLLVDACTRHTRGGIDADPTVQTCWDADRLDLLRAWIEPAPHKLCTEAARDPKTITWANARSRREVIPEFGQDDWLDLGRRSVR